VNVIPKPYSVPSRTEPEPSILLLTLHLAPICTLHPDRNPNLENTFKRNRLDHVLPVLSSWLPWLEPTMWSCANSSVSKVSTGLTSDPWSTLAQIYNFNSKTCVFLPSFSVPLVYTWIVTVVNFK
jgi:hypothetical protein